MHYWEALGGGAYSEEVGHRKGCPERVHLIPGAFLSQPLLPDSYEWGRAPLLCLSVMLSPLKQSENP